MNLKELHSLAETVDTARRMHMRVASDLAHELGTVKTAKLAQDLVDTGSELLADLQTRIGKGGAS